MTSEFPYLTVTSELSKTVTGKMQKFQMREIATEALGLQEASRQQTA